MSGRRRGGAPYRPGDAARVLHWGTGGTTVGTLPVSAVTARADGRWDVEFARAGELGPWSAVVGPDGRDRNGYVEPVRGSS